MHLGWSSNVYPLEAGELAQVGDYGGEPIRGDDLPDDEVVLFFRKGQPDALLRGRARIEAANTRNPREAVPVRLVFKPSIAKWNLLPTLIRVLRNKYRFKCSGVYHIAPQMVRGLGVERACRTLENPQQRKGVDRAAKMQRLAESLRAHGYDDAKPIVIQLCRVAGCRDSLRQGHHRISACLTCGVDRMAVKFSAAGALPREIGGNRK